MPGYNQPVTKRARTETAPKSAPLSVAAKPTPSAKPAGLGTKPGLGAAKPALGATSGRPSPGLGAGPRANAGGFKNSAGPVAQPSNKTAPPASVAVCDPCCKRICEDVDDCMQYQRVFAAAMSALHHAQITHASDRDTVTMIGTAIGLTPGQALGHEPRSPRHHVDRSS